METQKGSHYKLLPQLPSPQRDISWVGTGTDISWVGGLGPELGGSMFISPSEIMSERYW
jgi:hypothetical protein